MPKRLHDITDVEFTTLRDGVVVTTDAKDSETLHVTHDGGRTWKPIARPPRPLEFGLVLGQGVTVDARANAVSVTTDEGANWELLARNSSDQEYCRTSRPTTADIWITCAGDDHTILFYSDDGGRTWAPSLNHADVNLEVRGTGGAEAWATSTNERYPAGNETSSLWHTTDGGATWTQVWINLQPQVTSSQIDCAVVPSGVSHEPRDDCG